jgi:uncharacterized protein YkwD
MIWICKWFKKRTKKKIMVVETNIEEMTISELVFCLEVNSYRRKLGLNELELNGHLLTLAKHRMAYWTTNDIKKNLHFEFFGDRKPYLENGFKLVLELANYGIVNDFESFKKSPEHNEGILIKELKYIAVSMKGNWCCVILGY